MSNVCFRHSLSNPTLLNPGDDGYDPYEDDGAFIIQMRYNSSGVGIKSKGGSILLDTILFGFGFNKKASPVINVYSYVDNLFHGFGSDKEYFYTREAVFKDNESNIDTKETNNTDQIDKRGNLIKSATTTPGDSAGPQLINVGGGYAESKYVVARRSGSYYNKIQVFTSISASILEDETSRWWLFGWHEDGKLIEYGRTNGTYQATDYQKMEDVNISSGADSFYIGASTGHQIYKFVPTISGNYRFETISSYGDPDFSVSDATANKTFSAIDDLDGEDDRDARLDMYLTAGHIYYIDAFSHNSSYGYSMRIGYSPDSSLSITRDVNVSCSVDKGAFKMYKFVPETTGYYDIFTIAQSGDPYLFLFDSDGNKLKENDDGLGNLNSLISYYLNGGRAYYIAIQGYRGNATISSSLKVTPSIVNCNKISLNESLNVTVASYTYVYEFTAPSTGSFDFYTYENSGDPYLELYDANRNQIAYNDDYENFDDYHNSLIRYNLVAGQKYYIHVTSYNLSVASYKLSVKLSA